MRAEAAAAALLALAALLPVLADTATTAVLALDAPPPVLADAATAALLAGAAHPPVLADAAAAAVLAPTAPPPVLARTAAAAVHAPAGPPPVRTGHDGSATRAMGRSDKFGVITGGRARKRAGITALRQWHMQVCNLKSFASALHGNHHTTHEASESVQGQNTRYCAGSRNSSSLVIAPVRLRLPPRGLAATTRCDCTVGSNSWGSSSSSNTSTAVASRVVT